MTTKRAWDAMVKAAGRAHLRLQCIAIDDEDLKLIDELTEALRFAREAEKENNGPAQNSQAG